MKIDSRDEDLRAVMSSREDALREVEKLVHHTEMMEKNNRQKVAITLDTHFKFRVLHCSD